VLDYRVVDVFTDTAFAGNPLAVVLGADDLSTEQLQSVAREFNLSETAFPMAPSSADASYRLRIFTPTDELPFAGHPSIGSAWVMHDLGRVGSGRVVQQCGAGLIGLDVRADGITLSGGTPTVSEPLDPDDFCSAVGLSVGDMAGAPVRWAGTGLSFAYLHVRDDAVVRAAPDIARMAALGNGGVDVFSWSGGRVHSRVFAGGVGVTEDPATGSAALGLGVWLVTSGLVPDDGSTSYVIEQGIEMQRPSRLACAVEARAGVVVTVTVTGTTVLIAEGRISIPASR
jgi:trans-2,3-dihydro-3-hydroxyanthranilate isomerase